jgi:hypothetical protein
MKNRLLLILRRWGLYHGPIHYRLKAKGLRVTGGYHRNRQ